MDVVKRNRQVKKLLSFHLGKTVKVSVTGGRGTAYGWCHIDLEVVDPCPFKQHTDSCSVYCKEGICKGNDKPIQGGWGDTVRSLKHKELTEKVEELIEGVEFYIYWSDEGCGPKRKEVLINVSFKEGEAITI